jgi:ribosomal protein L37AE/L43A
MQKEEEEPPKLCCGKCGSQLVKSGKVGGKQWWRCTGCGNEIERIENESDDNARKRHGDQ